MVITLMMMMMTLTMMMMTMMSLLIPRRDGLCAKWMNDQRITGE